MLSDAFGSCGLGSSRDLRLKVVVKIQFDAICTTLGTQAWNQASQS